MTQIASLLAVATVFIGLWTLLYTFYCQGGSLYTRQNYLCRNLACTKNAAGGIIAGFYGTSIYM